MKVRATLAVPAVLAALMPGSMPAQVSTARIGTVVVAHGGDSTWNSFVLDAAMRANTGGPIEVSFLMGPAATATRFQDAVARLERSGSESITVVPLLVSSHSGHFEQIRYLAGDTVPLDHAMQHHLHMSGIERPTTRLPMRVAAALDDSPRLARVLLDRARALSAEPARDAVMIVGHGPNSAEDYAAWMENLRRIADSVKASGGFHDVRVDVVRDDAPAPVRAEAVKRVRELIELQYKVTGRPVVVVPVLVSRGSISRDKLPADLAGLPIVYRGDPLLPHPEMSRWIEDRARVDKTLGASTPR